MLVYATETDLGAWIEPADIDTESGSTVSRLVLLREASRLVRGATILDEYDVDDTRTPTRPDIAEAFSDATCRQVAEWIANEIDPVAGEAGVDPLESSTSIAGATVAYNVTAAAAARAQLAVTLCAASRDILRDAQLASGSPRRA